MRLLLFGRIGGFAGIGLLKALVGVYQVAAMFGFQDGAVGALVIAVVAAEDAVAEPAVLLAVTETRIVTPTSADVSRYVALVAPVIAAQEAPVESHRRHWYVWVSGAVPVQDPTAAAIV
jgi:hypothetical protein